jgi:hypothetical protein
MAEYRQWQSNLALISYNEVRGWPISSPEQVKNILAKRAVYRLSVSVFEARYFTQSQPARPSAGGSRSAPGASTRGGLAQGSPRGGSARLGARRGQQQGAAPPGQASGGPPYISETFQPTAEGKPAGKKQGTTHTGTPAPSEKEEKKEEEEYYTSSDFTDADFEAVDF